MKVEQQTESQITEISIPEIVPVIPSHDIIYQSN